MHEPDYSIIIPAYNEQTRIGATLDRVMECIEAHRWQAEVLVVNDGSTDRTAAIIDACAVRCTNLRRIDNPGNRGKGYSVRNGMLQARGAIVMFTDADLSAPMEEAELLFAAIADGADVAIGSRWLDRSRQTMQQPLYRRLFGRCFNAITRLVMQLPVADTQCGFKAFRQSAAQSIFIRQRIERWGFDPEILYVALRLGLRVQEVAVTWGHDDRSRISYLRDGLKMLEELIRVRFYSLAGYYDGNRYLEEGTAACGACGKKNPVPAIKT
ncbi:MAG: dolichyl-phosphate beta-glucosyltransferase [Acidobacteriaceae bacterium]